jgi:hypothetical protein
MQRIYIIIKKALTVRHLFKNSVHPVGVRCSKRPMKHDAGAARAAGKQHDNPLPLSSGVEGLAAMGCLR